MWLRIWVRVNLTDSTRLTLFTTSAINGERIQFVSYRTTSTNNERRTRCTTVAASASSTSTTLCDILSANKQRHKTLHQNTINIQIELD